MESTLAQPTNVLYFLSQVTFWFAGLFFYYTTLLLQVLKDNEQSIKAFFENLSLSEATSDTLYDDIVSFSEGIAGMHEY